MKANRHLGRVVFYALLTLAIMIFIFVMSAQDGEHSEAASEGFLSTFLGSALGDFLPELTAVGIEYDIRKYAHMAEYACLNLSAFLLMWELLWERSHRLKRASTAALALCFLYACSDEWHQCFVPGRTGRFSDVLVDMAGACMAMLLALIVCWIQTMFDKSKKTKVF